MSKKRAAGEDPHSSRTKRNKSSLTPSDPLSLPPADLEASLALPTSSIPEDELRGISVHTNRAPLVLAFAVQLLNYTQPSQPLSSRLSLAQAVVSANSRSKAVNIGLASGKSAEEEGWGQGWGRVKVMGREVRVLKRWGYQWRESLKTKDEEKEMMGESQDSVSTIKQEDKTHPGGEERLQEQQPEPIPMVDEDEPALWGLDLESLRSSSSSFSTTITSKNHTSSTNTPLNPSNLPIHTPQSARSYLLRSFPSSISSSSPSVPPICTSPDPAPSSSPNTSKSKPNFKPKPNPKPTDLRESNLGHLLKAIELLYASWSPYISTADLDRRAWGWYVAVRPDVADGQAGWGSKGNVKMEKILGLRRKG